MEVVHGDPDHRSAERDHGSELIGEGRLSGAIHPIDGNEDAVSTTKRNTRRHVVQEIRPPTQSPTAAFHQS